MRSGWLALLGIQVGIAMGMASPAIATSADSFKIVFGSCAHQDKDQGFWAPMTAERPDLFMLVGDNVYSKVSGPEMTEQKRAYETLSGHVGFQRLKETAPLIATWDDHDFGRNDAGASFPYRVGAEALFEAFFPGAPGSERDNRPGIYDSWSFGPERRRVQVILLDTRFFRDDLKPTDDRGAPGKERYLQDPSPAKSMLGSAQWAWLERRLRDPARLRVIVSSIQVIADGHGFERWGNLPLERDRLYRLISQTKASGVVLVSGDRHRAGLYRRAGVAPYPLYEITSSSLNLPFAAEEPGPHRLGPMFGEANYGTVELDWLTETVRLNVKAMDGGTALQVDVALSDLGPYSVSGLD